MHDVVYVLQMINLASGLYLKVRQLVAMRKKAKS